MSVEELRSVGLNLGSAKLVKDEIDALAAPAALSPKITPPVPVQPHSAAPSPAAAGAVPASIDDPYALFVAAYGGSQAPMYPDQLLAAVRETTFAFCRKFRVGEAEAVRYFKEVQAEAVGHKDELLDSIAESAVLVWTSAKRLTLAPGTTIEFCSLLNRILREHDPDLLPSACVVVRGINLLCVMRRDESKLLYPPGGESHRGGGLPLQHVPFFAPGKKFRVPMFLATSFDEDVAFKCGAARPSAPLDLTLWRQVLAHGVRRRLAPRALDCSRGSQRGDVADVRADSVCRAAAARHATAQVSLQARQPGGEEQRQGRSGVSFRAIFRLHRCISARARQAHRQQPHRHRAGGCHRQP
jgi:hypothetical protein